MPIKVVIPGLNHFRVVLLQLFDQEGAHLFHVKPQVGAGSIKQFDFKNGLSIYLGEIQTSEAVHFVRKASSPEVKMYSLYLQLLVPGDVKGINVSPDRKLTSEGMFLFGPGSTLNSLWPKNTRSINLGIYFTHEWLSKLLLQAQFPAHLIDYLSQTPDLSLFLELSQEMKENIIQMVHPTKEISEPYLSSYIYAKSLEILVLAFSSAFQKLDNADFSRLHPRDIVLIEHIKADLIVHYNEPPTIDEICRINDISKSTFQRLFKKVTKQSVYRFVKNIRMEKAMALMLQHHNLSEVAYEVGYSSLQNFSNAFKQHYKESPQLALKRLRIG